MRLGGGGRWDGAGKGPRRRNRVRLRVRPGRRGLGGWGNRGRPGGGERRGRGLPRTLRGRGRGRGGCGRRRGGGGRWRAAGPLARGPIGARHSRRRAARPPIRGRARGRRGRGRAGRPLTRGRTRPGRARRRAAWLLLGTGLLRAARRFRCGREARGPGGPGRGWLPGGALRGPGVHTGRGREVIGPGPGCRNHRLRAGVPHRRPVRGAGPRLRPVPHRPRRRSEPVVEGIPSRCGARVVGGVVVQLPPPVVLVTGGPSPLLAHARNCPPHEPDENGACGKNRPAAGR